MFHFTRTSKREHALYVHFTRIGNIEQALFDIKILNNTVYRQSKGFTTCIQHNTAQNNFEGSNPGRVISHGFIWTDVSRGWPRDLRSSARTSLIWWNVRGPLIIPDKHFHSIDLYPSRLEKFIHRWIDVGPSSTTLAQHRFNNGRIFHVCWDSTSQRQMSATAFWLCQVAYIVLSSEERGLSLHSCKLGFSEW